MKKTIFLCTLLSMYFFIHKANSQTVTTVEYDFNGKTLTPNQSLTQMKPGDLYRVVIHHINGNLYKVSINGRDTTTTGQITVPTFTSLDIAGITSALAGINPPATSTVQAPSGSSSPNFVKDKSSVKTITIDNKVGKEMLNYKVKLQDFLQKLIALQKRMDDIQLNINTYELNQLQSKPTNLPTFDYASSLTEITTLRNDIYQLQSDVNSSLSNYMVFSSEKNNAAAIAKDPALVAADKGLQTTYGKLTTGCSDLLTSISPDKAHDLLAGAIYIQNNADTDYISLPFQYQTDKAKLSLVIEPRSTDHGLDSYKVEFDFPLLHKDYAGVGISFYTSWLHDEDYSTVGTTTNGATTYEVQPEKFTKAEVGITALLRLGTKIGTASDPVGYHFSFGPGVSISNTVKGRLLAGGGLSFGTKNMFTIDAGIIAGYVNTLSSTIDLTVTNLTTPPANLTVSTLKAAGFVSIGYLYRFQ